MNIKEKSLLLIVALTGALPLGVEAQNSMLRVTCDENASRAEISINGTFKGECPVDVQVTPGTVRLKAFRKTDESWEQQFSDEFMMGDGVVKKIEVQLSAPRLTAIGQQRAARSLAEARPPAGSKIAIALAAFEGNPETWTTFVRVLRSDLERSGRFRLIESGGLVMNERLDANISVWKSSSGGYVLGGTGETQPDSRINLRFRAWDLTKGVNLGGQSLLVDARNIGLAAHKTADWLQEKITGIPGTFERRIAEVVQANGRYTLLLSDGDGANQHVAMVSRQPVGLPMLSATGKRLSYLSFESGKPGFYVQELVTAKRSPNVRAPSLIAACSAEIATIQGFSGTDASPQSWMKDDWAKNQSAECATTMAASLSEN